MDLGLEVNTGTLMGAKSPVADMLGMCPESGNPPAGVVLGLDWNLGTCDVSMEYLIPDEWPGDDDLVAARLVNSLREYPVLVSGLIEVRVYRGDTTGCPMGPAPRLVATATNFTCRRESSAIA